MRRWLPVVAALLICSGCREKGVNPSVDEGSAGPVPVAKRNPLKIYAHYMPWFETPESSAEGRWGIHWRMATRDPEQVDGMGRRQIAAHFYPLIGPYASGDADVVEYHLLLMKLAGIDGVLIDWYGTHDVFDYAANRRNSEALIGRLESVGLEFAVVYEDDTAGKVAERGGAASALAAAEADLRYLQEWYFSHPQHIRVDGSPLLLTFGPRLFETEGEWTRIFSGIEPRPHFLTLWHQSAEAGGNAVGEFAWVYENYLDGLDGFYGDSLPRLKMAIGAAYPGFRDFYREGGWGDGLGWEIDHAGGAVLAATLERAGRADIDALQLVTWNDFGEGTVIEPTLELGYSLLEQVQGFAGVEYGDDELELAYRLYMLRKRYAGDRGVQERLDRVFEEIVGLRLERAAAMLEELE